MARTHRHRPTRRRRGPLAGRRGYAALGTGVAAIAGGVMAVLPHHTPTARTAASDCGLVACTAPVPSPAIASITATPGASPSPHRTRRPHRKSRHRARPHPRHTKTPSPHPTPPNAPASPPPPPPVITVTYTVTRQRSGSFQGRFTITNHGSSYLNGWQLSATLPGDEFTSAWGSAYQVNGDTITYNQALLQGGIGPGSSLTLSFAANGSTTSPASCSIDGSACAA